MTSPGGGGVADEAARSLPNDWEDGREGGRGKVIHDFRSQNSFTRPRPPPSSRERMEGLRYVKKEGEREGGRGGHARLWHIFFVSDHAHRYCQESGWKAGGEEGGRKGEDILGD